MKSIWILLLLCSLGTIGRAQPYGNEWIDHSLEYYSFPVFEDGVYRISRSALINAGIPVSSIAPSSIMLFGKEKEIPLYIKGSGDGTFDSGDYIEFYADRNDGWLDSLLFNNPDHQGNEYYSMYNDTLRYYLTWDPSATGKRVTQANSSGYGSYSPEPWVWRKVVEFYSNSYYQGPKNVFGGSSPLYQEGEGWMSNSFNKGGSITTSLSTPSAGQGGGFPDAVIEAVSASASNASSVGGFNHHIQVVAGVNNSIKVDSSYLGYQLNRFQFSLSSGDLGIPTTPVVHRSIDDLGVATDYHRVASVKMKYPYTGNLDGVADMDFQVPFNTSDNVSRVSFTNFSGSTPLVYRLNGNQRIRISGALSSGNVDMLIPNLSNGAPAECLLFDPSTVKSIGSLSPVNGNGQFTDYAALDRDSAFVLITHASLLNAAQQYSSQVRAPDHNTIVVDVEELYHQFGGGIRKNALSIRRFSDFLLDQWSTDPSYLFLVGKSIREANESSPGSRKNGSNFRNNLVPSYGYPSSDMLFTSGLGGSGLSPEIPTGRLSAKNPQEVDEYRAKMLEHVDPSRGLAEWMKRVLHFGGGSTASEQSQFSSYLSQYESIIEDTAFGGHVHTFLKTSSNPISMNVSDSVTDLISSGASLLTFFGHASGSGFDQSLDHPSSYQNKGRYPVLLANACYSGDIHQPTAQSTSEEFVLYPNGGVIGFISMVKLGLAFPLHRYSQSLYHRIAHDSYYGRPLGSKMKNTIDSLLSKFPGQPRIIETCFGMTLHGDPALSLHSPEKPEFSLKKEEIFFEPKTVTSSLDSFDVKVILTNLGRGTLDTVGMELTRNYPGGQMDSTYRKSLNGSIFKDTVTFRLPVDAANGTGLNSFDVRVDRPANRIPEEEDERFNNEVTAKELYIRSGNIIPIYPYEYAIIPENSTTLKASTGNPFAPARDYIFQLDTTDEFNSPFLRQTTLHHSGGVVTWDPQLTFTDSTVYFWRTAPVNSNLSGSDKWRESSFQYIPNRRGWGQSHYFQFKKDDYQQLLYDRPDRDFDFFSGSQNLACRVFGNASNSNEFSSTEWKLGLEVMDYDGCGVSPAIHVAVVDPNTHEPWNNKDHYFGNLNGYQDCRTREELYFIFRQNNADQMDSLVTMIEDHVPDSFHVLVYSWRYAVYGNWDADVVNLFQNMGADSIGVAQDSVPFIFYTKKGDLSSAQEVYGQDKNEIINFSTNIKGTGNSGQVTSERLGPAASWGALYWETHSKEINSQDSSVIKLLGVDRSGADSLLAEFPVSMDSVPDLYNYIDAMEHPYLKLRGYLADDSSRTPEQIDRWQVLYEPKPEAALDASTAFSFHADTLQEGEEMKFDVAVRNVSEFDMDSMLMAYWIEDNKRVRRYISYARKKPLNGGEVLYDSVTFQTAGFPGENALWVEANPVDTLTGFYDQLEQYHFNNIARLTFKTERDKINPILDVTFDGRHIMDGDIISAEPEIQISLDDENQYLLMDEEEDTSNFRIWMIDPDGVEKRVHFKQNGPDYTMQWVPAKEESKKNKFKILYEPELEEDGAYKLKVEAEDESSNRSGSVRFEVSFEVINKTTVTNVMNYPNPFSTRTQFVFTLTGSSPPEQFRIQIMTISGKVVREIEKQELGPLYIGRNRTSYWWDGTDEFGDPLGNGLYLYRVIVRDDGEAVEKRKTGADKYFEKEFGKMYLMR